MIREKRGVVGFYSSGVNGFLFVAGQQVVGERDERVTICPAGSEVEYFHPLSS